MNTFVARSVSTTRNSPDAAQPMQAAAACASPLALRLAAMALSVVLSLGLVQSITYSMGQQSSGVSLAQHLRSPNVAMQMAEASSAPGLRP